MSLNYEIDRHIVAAREAGMEEGAQYLEGMRIGYNALLKAGKLPNLPILEMGEENISGEKGTFERLLDPEDSITLSEFLREYRQKEHYPPLSQEVAATKAGTSLAWYQKLEQGRGNPRLGTLTRLAHGFGFKPEITTAFIRKFGNQ